MTDFDVVRDDLALDALAAGRAPEGDDAVLGLLHALRTDLDAPAADPVVVPFRPRRRGGFFVGLSAAAGLIIGGLTAGAVVTSDEPGQLLYAAHKAVLGDTKAAERVDKLLDDADEEIAEGDLDKARDLLAKATERLVDVDDPDQRATLLRRLDRLRALAGTPVTTPPRASASPQPRETDEPSETPEPRESEDSSGSGSDDSGSGSGSSGSGSDDSTTSGSDDSGSDSSGKGSDSDDVLKTPDVSGDSSGHGGGDDD